MVTFETKVYEKDWKYLLKDGFLEENLKRCNYKFTCKNIYINNVEDIDRVLFYAEKLKKDNIIHNIYVVNDFELEVLDFFNLSKEDFNGGYYYSIAELTSIYLCSTEYLLHFSSDSFLQKNNTFFNWIDQAIIHMENKPEIIVANPVWNFNFKEARKESIQEIENFFLGFGFSDQCYLIKAEIFKKDIYREYNVISQRYPDYGGELFEKRVDAYMRNNNFKRITSKEISYIHKNYPKDELRKLCYEFFPFFHKYKRFKL